MTNEMIIYNARMQLMENGIIFPTGRVFTARDGAGQEITVQEPEQIHTYSAWKNLGFQVRKGQKAVAKFSIWKYAAKKDEENPDGEEEEYCFMQKACFFAEHQVEAMDS